MAASLQMRGASFAHRAAERQRYDRLCRSAGRLISSTQRQGYVWVMNNEQFSKIASGIQAIVVSLAVIVGGGWTLYTFGSLQQVERARTEVEKLRRSLLERGVLVITLRPSQVKSAQPSTRYVLVDVAVQNQGNSTEVIDWSKSGLRLTKVDVDRGGGLAFGQTLDVGYSLPGRLVQSSSILPGQTRGLAFLVPLQQPGVYHIAFEAIISPTETAVHMREHALIGVTPDEVMWGASTYFSVE
jgi:hypothetical protein